MERSQLAGVVRIRCFICEKISRQGKTNERRQRTAFIMLLRYLEVDVEQFSKTDLSRLPMCVSCSCRMECFWELYQEFESVRLYLDEDVKALQEIMEGDDRTCPVGKRNMSGGRRNAEKRKLREVIIKKCARKLGKAPRVKLERRYLANNQRMKISTTSRLKGFDLIIDDPRTDDGVSDIIGINIFEDEGSPDNNIDENDDLSDDAFSENEVFSVLKDQHQLEGIEVKQNILHINPDNFSNPCSVNSVEVASNEEEDISRTKMRTGKIPSFECDDDDDPLEKTYECPSCPKTFRFYKSFLTHQKKVHGISHLETNVKVLYKCKFCQKPQQSEKKKRIHMVRIHLMQLYADRIPPTVTKKQLNVTATFLSENQKVYSSRRLGCPYCPRMFSLSHAVRDHLKDCHFDKILIALKDPEHSSLQPVQRSLHLPGKLKYVSDVKSLESYKCPICEKTFPDPFTYKSHQKHCHTKGKKQTSQLLIFQQGPGFACDFCQKFSYSERDKQLHIVRKHLMQLYSKLIPSGVSKKELDSATRILADRGKFYGDKELGCPFCSRLVHLRLIREHILDKHFDKVLVAVRNPQDLSLQPVQIQHKHSRKGRLLINKTKSENEVLQDHNQDSNSLKKINLNVNLDDIEDEVSEEDSHSDNSDEEDSSEEGSRAPKQAKMETRRCTTSHSRDEDSLKKTYECISCQQVFNTYGLFYIHQKKVHNVVHDFKLTNCDFCQKPLGSKTGKEMHMARKHIMELYADKIPPGVTKDTLKATAAMLSKHQKVYNPKSLGCPYCPELFSAFRHLKNHIQAHHFEKILFALENPEHSSLQRVEGLQHKFRRAVSDAKSVKSYQCSICQKQFTVYSTFQSHKRHYHNRTSGTGYEDEDGSSQCSYCELRFSMNHLLILHCYRKHAHSYLKDMLKLPPDSTQLQLEEGLAVLIEKGEIRPGRRITCTICKKVHLARADLRIHILDKHLPSVVEKLKEIPVPEEVEDEASFWCSICRVFLDSEIVLEEHRQKLHPKDAFSCKYCSNTFRGEGHKKMHNMRMHGFQFFENLLPSGTTEEEYKAALEMVLSKRNKFEENGCSWFGCPRPGCGEKVFKNNSELKRHVLCKHSQDVIEILWK